MWVTKIGVLTITAWQALHGSISNGGDLSTVGDNYIFLAEGALIGDNLNILHTKCLPYLGVTVNNSHIGKTIQYLMLV